MKNDGSTVILGVILLCVMSEKLGGSGSQSWANPKWTWQVKTLHECQGD